MSQHEGIGANCANTIWVSPIERSEWSPYQYRVMGGLVSLDQIRYFVAVAEQGTTRGAARRLAISQPPLTRCILALEDELGVKLFVRSSRGMSLRKEGAEFLRHARSILKGVDQAVAAMRGHPKSSEPSDLATTGCSHKHTL